MTSNLTPEQLGRLIFLELTADHWGTIDPLDFEADATAESAGMQQVLQRVIDRLPALSGWQAVTVIDPYWGKALLTSTGDEIELGINHQFAQSHAGESGFIRLTSKGFEYTHEVKQSTTEETHE